MLEIYQELSLLFNEYVHAILGNIEYMNPMILYYYPSSSTYYTSTMTTYTGTILFCSQIMETSW